MSIADSSEKRETNGKSEQDSVAQELRNESERLRILAEKLQAREEALSEMEANYESFRQFVYARMKQELALSAGDLPDRDLEAYAREHGALPFETFFGEVER